MNESISILQLDDQIVIMINYPLKPGLVEFTLPGAAGRWCTSAPGSSGCWCLRGSARHVHVSRGWGKSRWFWCRRWCFAGSTCVPREDDEQHRNAGRAKVTRTGEGARQRSRKRQRQGTWTSATFPPRPFRPFFVCCCCCGAPSLSATAAPSSLHIGISPFPIFFFFFFSFFFISFFHFLFESRTRDILELLLIGSKFIHLFLFFSVDFYEDSDKCTTVSNDSRLLTLNCSFIFFL